jgi:hypothetical protein
MSKSCPIPPAGGRCRRIGAGEILVLVGFVVPTLAIGYGIVIPRSCIAGVNELTIGFGTTVLGAVVTYLIGVRRALRR